jgi:hypothetical protein
MLFKDLWRGILCISGLVFIVGCESKGRDTEIREEEFSDCKSYFETYVNCYSRNGQDGRTAAERVAEAGRRRFFESSKDAREAMLRECAGGVEQLRASCL